MSFLFDTSGRRTNPIQFITKTPDGDNTLFADIPKAQVGKQYAVFKKQVKGNTENIKDFLKNASLYGAQNDTDENPYLRLLNTFKGTPMEIKPADLVYLRDQGVSPINRMVILRRFSKDVLVPNNLTKLNKQVRPISTVIGWLPNEPAETLPFSVSFNEEWTTVNAAGDRLDTLIKNILNDETGNLKLGDKIANIIPVPSWSQGLLFNILHEMGLTTYNSQNLPLGDPNVNKEASTRNFDDSKNHLEGKFQQLEFKTVYEQKYFEGKDSGQAMLDIINNLLHMGTDDMKFILSQSSEIIQKLRSANNAGNDWTLWATLTEQFVVSFVTAFSKGVITEIGKLTNSISGLGGNTKTTADTSNESEFAKKVKAIRAKQQADAKAQADSNNPNSAQNNTALAGLSAVLGKDVNTFISSVLTSTIKRYQWKFRGSIGLMTGESTTFWHLTIGNPLNPIISLNNVIVENITLNLSNDLSYNDMPKQVIANIRLKLGRDLGGQEILQSFNNGYLRIYSDPTKK